jgi:hypothetical protein
MRKKTNTKCSQNCGRVYNAANRLCQKPISGSQSSGWHHGDTNSRTNNELSECYRQQIRIVELGVSIVSRMSREGIAGTDDLDRLGIFCSHVRTLTDLVKLLLPLLEKSSDTQNQLEDFYSK